MSTTDKYFVAVTRMTKWTGDNLDELSTIWAAELASHDTEFTVNPDGSLAAGNDFFGFGYPVPEGNWFCPGSIRGVPEQQLFATNAEVSPIELPE